MAAILVTACSSGRDKRAEEDRAEAAEDSDDVLAAFEAWANDPESNADRAAGSRGGNPDDQGDASSGGALDAVIEQFNRKVSACWKQPFGMPRLATVRLLVQFNPDGTVRDVTPRPDASEALLYRTKAPYLVMIAQTSRALRQCQPYEGIRQNFARLRQLEMVFDPSKFRN